MTMNLYVKEECLFHHINTGEVIIISYQVIQAIKHEEHITNYDMNIRFFLSDPNGLKIISDKNKYENIHRYKAQKDGQYVFCFTNNYGAFNEKKVLIGLIVKNEEDNNENKILEGLPPNSFSSSQVIMDSIRRTRMHTTNTRNLQDVLRTKKNWDLNFLNRNYLIINYWSSFQICAMLLIGGLQILMIKLETEKIYVKQLQEELKKRGLPTCGSKKILRKRIIDDDKRRAALVYTDELLNPPTRLDTKDEEDQNTRIILDSCIVEDKDLRAIEWALIKRGQELLERERIILMKETEVYEKCRNQDVPRLQLNTDADKSKINYPVNVAGEIPPMTTDLIIL
ncbi:transmembrane emp24 domain-containing protein 5-like isoform X2 [Episyrphus balteatus]|nr:transmembrane emp24 domain-containing protein 5-like isoform X2 [Episyrphus balteatus]